MVPGLNAFKLAVINLIGSRLFDDGVTDDQRFMLNAYGIPLFTQMGLADLGVTETTGRRPGDAPRGTDEAGAFRALTGCQPAFSRASSRPTASRSPIA